MNQLPDTMTWPEWLRSRMAVMGLSNAAFARQLGYAGTREISRWRADGQHRPPSTEHANIAHLLGVAEWEVRIRLKRERDAHAQGSTPVGAA